MVRIEIISLLDKKHSVALEELLFFNPQQGRFRQSIVASVQQYGSPEIVHRNGGLRVQLKSLPDVQTLYALAHSSLSEKLVGAVVFTRIASDMLEILHIVVRPEFACGGEQAHQGLALQLIDEACRVGRQIAGVKAILLAYNRGKVILKRP